MSLFAGFLHVGTAADVSQFNDMRAHADKGEPEAQNALGLMYRNGRGVTQDFTQAIQWFQKAAEHVEREGIDWGSSLTAASLTARATAW